MSVIVYPGSLPQYFMSNGFSLGVSRVDVVQTDMDIGPSKRRTRSFSKPIPVSGQIVVDINQLETFNNWYNLTLGGGVQPFQWVHPLKRTLQWFRFENPKENPPQVSLWEKATTYFIIKMQLEMLE